MPKGIAAVAGLILAVSLALPVAAQTPPAADDTTGQTQRGRGKEARQAQRAAALFSEAATTYAEIVNLCLTDRAPAVRVAISSARGELTRLRPMLNDEKEAAALEKRFDEMVIAEANGNLIATGLAAAEAFRIVVTTMDEQLRRTPLQVSLHTYSAFKLDLLASAAQIDWTAVGKTAKESEKSWIALRRMVRDTNLRVLLSEVQSGLRDAVSRNDPAGVKFAARLQVGSTAVLRDFFERFARSMARGR